MLYELEFYGGSKSYDTAEDLIVGLRSMIELKRAVNVWIDGWDVIRIKYERGIYTICNGGTGEEFKCSKTVIPYRWIEKTIREFTY